MCKQMGLLVWQVGKGSCDQLTVEFVSHLVGREKLEAAQWMKCFSHFLCDS